MPKPSPFPCLHPSESALEALKGLYLAVVTLPRAADDRFRVYSSTVFDFLHGTFRHLRSFTIIPRARVCLAQPWIPSHPGSQGDLVEISHQMGLGNEWKSSAQEKGFAASRAAWITVDIGCAVGFLSSANSWGCQLRSPTCAR
ncbi:hypothetical protein P7K49_009071 [Saguinus oedipus]|uniref:Uncharacterized protein n=1 Tax=Saguinus oedipus TaxID=9490 RepID=A0ABQ9W045_SAGOE|nr:hypothetical protein P7K49_009071 [Saguinus oedipus]